MGACASLDFGVPLGAATSPMAWPCPAALGIFSGLAFLRRSGVQYSPPRLVWSWLRFTCGLAACARSAVETETTAQTRALNIGKARARCFNFPAIKVLLVRV